MWARGLWKVFLDSTEGLVKAIEYVKENPSKEGLPMQAWSFVTGFDPNG